MNETIPPPGGAQAEPLTEKTGAAPDVQQPQSRDSELVKYDEFADRVRRLCRESSGAQSALRAGLGKSVTEAPARMHATLLRPGLIREDPEGRGYADKERAYYAVAALIAARPRAQRVADNHDGPDDSPGDRPEPSGDAFRPYGTNLGESFALAVGRRRPDDLKAGAAESRLHLLVRQDLEGAHRMLPSVFRWLGSSGVSPDYACLLRDLTAWRYGRDAVSTRWLQEFYRSLRRQEAASEQQPVDPNA